MFIIIIIIISLHGGALLSDFNYLCYHGLYTLSTFNPGLFPVNNMI